MSLCLDRGWKREKWRWHRYIVYVQPGSIYLAIGAKTSSVRNMISLRYRKNFHTADFVFFNGGKRSSDSSLSAIILHTGDSHWLLAASQQPEGEGPCDSFALHCTQLLQGVLHFQSLTTRKKNCAYRRNGMTKIYSGFETMTFQTAVYLETGYRPMPTLKLFSQVD